MEVVENSPDDATAATSRTLTKESEEQTELMMVLLRHNGNGLYFQATTKWVSSPGEALDFLGTGQAIQAASDYRLKNVQVVLSFGNPQHDVVLPLLATATGTGGTETLIVRERRLS